MASIQKIAKGYRAQVYHKGQRSSRVFSTRRDAAAWADEEESRLKDGRQQAEKHTLRDLLRRYGEEVSDKKRGARWEQIRLIAFERRLPVDKSLAEISPADISAYRDARLKDVQPGTVTRELILLSSAFETARRDWSWVEANPCADVRKPPATRHRERVIAWQEAREILRQMGYRRDRVSTISQALAVCFLLAMRTGMRAGELCGLVWADVHSDYVRLSMTKNGQARDVPLSKKARRLLSSMRGWDDESVFGLKPQTVDALFRKYRSRAGLDGFVWHDTRHTAATMMAKRVDALTLCKIMGWRDPKFALVYYNPTASDIAAKL